MELWIAFALASAVILAIPGPTIILVVSQAAAHGPRSVLPLASGVLMGDFTAMSLSMLGLGALLSASAALFTAFKLAGAAYLVYLGVRLWRTDPAPQTQAAPNPRSGRSLCGRAFVVTALNPKSIAFFVAFLPQFIDPAKPATPQLALMGATFLTLAGLNAALYATFASRISAHIAKPATRKWLNRTGGTALITAGIATAAGTQA